MPDHRQHVSNLLPLAAAAGILFLVSLPALNGPLVLDSAKLFALQSLADEHGILAFFHTTGFGGELDRIVSMASFVLNVQIHGELSPFQLKLTNVALHVATGLLVFLFTRLVLRRMLPGDQVATIAVGAGVMWLLSPVNFNVTMYAIQRMAQLSALFTFAGLALYAAGRLQDDTRLQRRYIVLAALVCLPLAVFSKQNGALLVPLAFLAEVYLLHPVRPWFTARQLALFAVVMAAAGAAAVFYLYPGVLNYQQRDFTLVERLLSQPRALLDYLRHIVLPIGGDAGIYTDFAVSRSLLNPVSTLASLIGLVAMAVFCVVCRRGRPGLVAFGLAFFLVGHAMESTFVPLELYFLHRNYLPDYGIYFALACVIVFAMPDRKWVVSALVMYAAYFAAIDYARSLTWSSRENIVAAAVHHHPGSTRALADYAQLALDRGQFDLAARASDRAIELKATLAARVQRLYIRCRSGAEIAEEQYRELMEISGFGVPNELSQALGNLLALYERGGCSRLRVETLVPVLDRLAASYREHHGNPWTIAFYADSLLYAAGSRDLAHRRLQERLDAGLLEAGLYRLELLVKERNPDQARVVLARIEARFGPAQLRGFGGVLEDFRRRIEAL